MPKVDMVVEKPAPTVTESLAPTKRCSKCGMVKDLEIDFNRLKRGKGGYDCHCKRCQRDYHKLYYQNNLEKLRTSSREWARKHKTKLHVKSVRNPVKDTP